MQRYRNVQLLNTTTEQPPCLTLFTKVKNSRGVDTALIFHRPGCDNGAVPAAGAMLQSSSWTQSLCYGALHTIIHQT